MSNGDTPLLELLGSVTASIIVISFATLVLLVSIGMATLSIPVEILVVYVLVVTLSIIQVVGIDVLRAWRDE